MQRRVFLQSTLAAALVAGPAAARPLVGLHDNPVPLLSPRFQDAKGRTLHLDDFAGRVLVLNVWATWCPPCRQEMPALDALQARLGGKDFAAIPVSIDGGGIDVAQQFYDAIWIRNLGLYWGEDLRAKLAFGVFGLPTFLLINRNGQEFGRVSGPARWDGDAAIAQIARVIAEA